ncbi:MAG: hypothetical protein ACR2KK_07475 [Acidimicrobiales bacterium]
MSDDDGLLALLQADDRAALSPVGRDAGPHHRAAAPSLLELDELAETGWDADDDPALLTTPGAVESLGKRVRAIAFTKPLHDLEASKTRLGGESWSRLNMVELAFHAVDVVALRMDFDTGASYDDVVVAVSTLASLQVPGLADPERVGEKVIEGLITGRAASDADAHRTAFGTWGPDGYIARRYDFALVTEHLDSQGEVYLRATDPAITVLVGALELDLEGSQQAAELRIEKLVERGLLDAAAQQARTAKYRTIQYMDKLRRALSAARLHATDPGTLEAVDRLVDHAIEHVLDRYAAEGHILAGVGRTRDAAEDARVIRKANRLVEELRECQRRHQTLQHRLLTARSEFRQALAAQLATPPNPPTRVDLERQLLRPLLELPLSSADAVGQRVFAASGAPLAPSSPDLAQLVAALCTMPAAHDGLGGEVEEHDDLTDVAGSLRFPDEVWDVVAGLLGDISTPTRLSALLARAGDLELLQTVDEGAVTHLLALRAARALDPGVGDLARAVEPLPFLVAVADAARLETPTIEGDDVLLVPATLLHPIAAHDGSDGY